MMDLEILQTRDGSDTLYNSALNESYHSTFGAIQESRFIFIDQGLRSAFQTFQQEPLQILEIGFGTGLNAFLTQMEAEKTGRKVTFSSLEAYPLPPEIWQQLNYPRQFYPIDCTAQFYQLHQAAWNQPEDISAHFILHKMAVTLEVFTPKDNFFHGVFFDAFSPAVQPELWSESVFKKIFTGMKSRATLMTYSVKGSVVRALKSAGFTVEKRPGPPGKRHILCATKII
ncbi:MAG: tRNA (5-methylaminomethyl-2-thiouridine)(34)-methyltransferase MnmD [Bacteroidales bacterium]|nr:tRNA (5-methylaminomethyl-2-thiouridine)(34)-methyltransferase MnmD [Bacteroidales bacterium]